MIGQGIQDLGACQDVEPNEQDIVGQQHESREVPCGLALSKDVVSEVTYPSNVSIEAPTVQSRILHSQISLICGYFMMYLCIVIEVYQNIKAHRIMVMIPGTHPSTLNFPSVSYISSIDDNSREGPRLGHNRQADLFTSE